MSKIKTFAEACKVIGMDPNDFELPADADAVEKSINAYRKLVKVIVPALNEGWVADFADSSQRKYYPWFYNYRAGSGFSGTYYDDSRTFTCVGSRLCFKSADLATYAATQFIDIYNEYL